MNDLREYLEQTAASWARLQHPAMMERFVLRNGQEFRGRKRPKGYRKGTAKQCFANAARLGALDHKTLRYVEGYAVADNLPIAFHHAWAIDADDQVIDVTLKNPENYQYMGVVVSFDEVWHEVSRQGFFGLFDGGYTGINIEWMLKRDPGLQPVVEEIIGRKIGRAA
jgi:hypothetical protein